MGKREEALMEATAALTDEHPLVRLAGVHTIARVAARGDRVAWESVTALVGDSDELVQVGVARAVGRIAEPGNADAINWLRKVQREAAREPLRLAARDAEA